jgi:hypothetical protein
VSETVASSVAAKARACVLHEGIVHQEERLLRHDGVKPPGLCMSGFGKSNTRNTAGRN